MIIVSSLFSVFKQVRRALGLEFDFSDLEIELSMDEIICDLHAGRDDGRGSGRRAVTQGLPAHTRICASTRQMVESSEAALRIVSAA